MESRRRSARLHLQYILSLYTVFAYSSMTYYSDDHVPVPMLASLQRFTQLRSLSARGYQFTTSAADSLPSLTSLELCAYELVRNDKLTVSLHRLCASQLDHVSLTLSHLQHLLKQAQQSRCVVCDRWL